MSLPVRSTTANTGQEIFKVTVLSATSLTTTAPDDIRQYLKQNSNLLLMQLNTQNLNTCNILYDHSTYPENHNIILQMA